MAAAAAGTKRGASESGGASAKPAKKKAAATPADKLVKRAETPRQAIDGASKTLDLVYWNVGGLRTALKKRSELLAEAAAHDPEVIAFAEHKLQAKDVETVETDLIKVFPNYRAIWACASERKGYSGVVLLLRRDIAGPIKPHSITNATVEVTSPEACRDTHALASCHRGLGIPPIDSEYNLEGRVITLNFTQPNVYVVFSYVPNSGAELKRLNYRIDTWEKDCRDFLKALEKDKPVCYIGDLNVAHLDLDIWNAGAKHLEKSAGTTAAERAAFGDLLSCGFVDGFRHFHPNADGNFSYWSVRARNRPHNRGLRLDYTVVSQALTDPAAPAQLADAYLLNDLCAPHGDHCAVGMTLKY